MGVEAVHSTDGATLRDTPKFSMTATFVFLCLVCLAALPTDLATSKPVVFHRFTARPADVLSAPSNADACPFHPGLHKVTGKKRKALLCGQEHCTLCGIAALAAALRARDLAFTAGHVPGRHASSYSAGSSIKVTWTCLNADCGHSFDATVKNVILNQSIGLPVLHSGHGSVLQDRVRRVPQALLGGMARVEGLTVHVEFV